MVQRFQDKVLSAIMAHRLLSKGTRLLLGVSGGLDSMSLLSIFCHLKSALQIELRVAHFNHQLRGAESDQDMHFVREHCQKAGVPFVEGAGDVASLAETSGISIEMAARKLRREFLATTARVEGCSHIALAQHADDQVETFFLRLFRGAGLEGLSGMDWSGPDPFDPGLTVIRPFLGVTRSEILEFAQAHKADFREDSSNNDSRFKRNFIRNTLLPLIRKEANPALNEAILRTMVQIQDSQAFVAERIVELKQSEGAIDFHALPNALQGEWIKQQLHAFSLPCSFELVQRLRTFPETWVEVIEGVSISLSKSGTLVGRGEKSAEFNLNQLPVNLSACNSLVLDELIISWETQPSGELPLPAMDTEYFDAQKVGHEVVLRHWRPGDKFQLIGNSFESKLQDIFVDLKIEVSSRRQLVVAEAVNKGLFWVQGLRISDAFKLDKGSRQRLKWMWARL